MLLEGIFLPLTTPFRLDGRLFLRKLEHNVDRYSRTPAQGMVVLGPGSEEESLNDEETREVLRTAIGGAAKEKVMVAGVGRESVSRTLDIVEVAAAAGYDAVAVRAPAFVGDESMRLELVTYFQAVADRAGVPVVMVSEPGRQIPAALLVELAGHPGILGAVCAGNDVAEVKAATASVRREVTVTTVFAAVTGRMLRLGSGDFVAASSLGGTAVLAAAAPGIKTRTKGVGFQILSGGTGGMLGDWQAGAVGAVPRLGAAAPQACCEVYQAWKDGDLGLAEEKQERVRAAAERMEGTGGVAWSKYGCDLNGYFGGRPRLPLLALNGGQREELEQVMVGLKN